MGGGGGGGHDLTCTVLGCEGWVGAGAGMGSGGTLLRTFRRCLIRVIDVHPAPGQRRV